MRCTITGFNRHIAYLAGLKRAQQERAGVLYKDAGLIRLLGTLVAVGLFAWWFFQPLVAARAFIAFIACVEGYCAYLLLLRRDKRSPRALPRKSLRMSWIW